MSYLSQTGRRRSRRQRTLNPTFPLGIPVCQILNFAKPPVRESFRLISKHWNLEAKKTEKFYYFHKVSQLQPFISKIFEPATNWKQRYIAMETKNFVNLEMDVVDQAPLLSSFLEKYSIVLNLTQGGKSPPPSCGHASCIKANRMSQQETTSLGSQEVTEVTIKETNSTICFESSFLDPPTFVAGSKVNVEIWLKEKKEAGKIALFGSMHNIFALWEGFDSDLDPQVMDIDGWGRPQPQDGFHLSYDAYDRDSVNEVSVSEELFPWFLDKREGWEGAETNSGGMDMGTEMVSAKFQVPPPPPDMNAYDLLNTAFEDMDAEYEAREKMYEIVFNKWEDEQNASSKLVRLRIDFGRRLRNDYSEDEFFPVTPSDLHDAVKRMNWI